MSDENRTPADETEAPATAPAGDETAMPDAVAALLAEKERLDAEVAGLKDKYLRAFAETENVRRRAEREIADAKVYGITNFARDVLAVADDLGRALEAIDAEARANADGTLKTLLDGVEMTERSLLKSMEKHGVARIEAEGARFDPHLHQAIFEVPNPDVTSGTVVQVMQSGYTLGGRVLRPAMVGVARGGPKAEKPAETQDPAVS